MVNSPLCETVVYQFLGKCASSRRKIAATPPSSFQVQPKSNEVTKPMLNQHVSGNVPVVIVQLLGKAFKVK